MKITKNIPIGGFHKQSLIDYLGHISAVVFTCGCNFRCTYCHNPQLMDSDLKSELNEEIVLEWVTQNKTLLDAVVITGGEPTIHSSLPKFIHRIKQLGLKVKLDTNGTNPVMLEKLINEKLIDYIAMDIKAPLSLMKYKKVVGNNFNDPLLNKLMQSVKILNRRQIDCEFRTTADDSLSVEDFITIAGEISCKYYIQNVVDKNRISIKKIENADLETINCNTSKSLEINLRN